MKLSYIAVCLTSLIPFLAPVAAHADTAGRHPAYLRARSDLRAATFLMRVREEPNVTRRLVEADRETEAAIRELDRAAVLDRKDLDDHPRVDTGLDRHHRFERIVALLRSARTDLAREEDNGRARGWRDAAYRHIDSALDRMHEAARDQHWDRDFGW